MTQKELLYMEDAIAHETNLIKIYTYSIELIQNKNLKSFMKNQLKKHEALKQKLMKVLEESVND